jgi:hypothetical protein
MKYTHLKKQVQDLETKWQQYLMTRFPTTPDPCMLNGQMQFFVVENGSQITADKDLPVVVAIGSNYGQGNKSYPWLTPYLVRDTVGNPKIIDPPALTTMRKNMVKSFQEYSAAPQAWVDRHLASANNIPIQKEFHLVVTNFSPFITCFSWQDYEMAERANLLSLLGGDFPHLDNLFNNLSGSVCLSVAHSLGSEVFSLFRLWQTRHSITPWLLTSNLSMPFSGAFSHRPRLCCPHCGTIHPSLSTEPA